jgi:MoaA/NifB/PqqE/SkfB family radical SAM enzyme
MANSIFPTINYINLELTSKCALKCSRCDRVEHKGMFTPQDLSLDIIKDKIPTNLFNENFLFDLSGNYGDPIYHSNFIEIIKYIKSFKVKIYLETNGSGRSTKWWDEVLSYLDNKDIISFSVDGLKDTNHLYRENAKWEDIEAAMKLCSSKVKTQWKYILFKHNEHQVEEAQKLATILGVHKFKTVKSSLFYYGYGENKDPLMPQLKNISTNLSKKIQTNKPASIDIKNKEITPKCVSTQRHYISAEGHYFPCCWMALKPKINESFLKNRLDELSLHNFSLDEILSSQIIQELIMSWDNEKNAPKVCQKKCLDSIQTNTSHDFSYADIK